MLAFDDPPVIVVMDDDPKTCEVVRKYAKPHGLLVGQFSPSADILSALRMLRPAAVLVCPPSDGVAANTLIGRVLECVPDCDTAVIVSQGVVRDPMALIGQGALDCLTKPLSTERLRELLKTVAKRLERKRSSLRLPSQPVRLADFHGMLGQTRAIQDLFDSIRRFAPHFSAALITGETGTGKELVARALHRMGPRSQHRLVTINCAAVVEGLFESELFGHAKGAFTGASESKAGLFETAHRGDLFLDEIGELPIGVQAKLLRALEYGDVQRVGSSDERKVDVRVIAATNRDLEAESPSRQFRSDLYYRLNVVELRIPPLRERPEDIPILAASFLRTCAHKLGKDVNGIEPEAERLLCRASWPGNVRQLRNVIERACWLCDDAILRARYLEKALGAKAPRVASSSFVPVPSDVRVTLASAQDRMIQEVLDHVNGNKSEAARVLGVSRRSIHRWTGRGPRTIPDQALDGRA